MHEWKITIHKVDNGYILEFPNEIIIDDERTEVVTEKEVVEMSYDHDDANKFMTDDEEKICLGRMLERIADHFGVMYQKFDANNLNISFDKKGHKLDD